MPNGNRRPTRLLLAAFAVGVVLAPATLRADETTFCNAFITSLPFTITAQGHYCFNRNLSTSQTTGAAIVINVDFVTLDLNGFKLGGGGAGLGTQAVGVLASNRKALVIRNGNIRGFRDGVQVNGASSNAIVIEDLRLDENTARGILVDGSNHVIRNNSISDTGGNTTGDTVAGIRGSGNLTAVQFLNNAIVNVTENSSNTGSPDGINVLGTDTSLLLVDNRIVNVVDAGIAAGGSICKDNIVSGSGGTAISCTFEVGTTNFP